MAAGAEREDRDLAVLAARQHGVVSCSQLERLGYSRSSVARAVAARRLHRLHRGVYAVGHTNLSWHGHCLAAVLASAPAWASHLSAAWIWGVLSKRPSPLHVTALTRRYAKTVIRLHYARLGEDDRARCDGIPLVALPRTLLDLAAMLPDRRLEQIVEQSEKRELFDLHAVEGLLERVKSHPGAGRLRRVLALYREEPGFTRSDLERRFLRLVKAAGLPSPSMNFNVAGYELDAYWELERFAVELDVYETHGTHQAFERDRLRQEDLKLIGVEMTRVTGSRLDREPDAVMERVAQLLEQRRRQLPFAVCRA